VSYDKLVSRSGNEQQFRDMVNRCNAVGIRIYVDAIINHMAGIGRKGNGSGGSSFDSDSRSFPGVPYAYNDFNDKKCRTSSGSIENYADVYQVRDCRLGGLTDLATGDEYVRNKISEYMNNLIDIGVAGFRIDAAKHMWPGDLQAIYSKLKNVREE
jgi:alpha-amylase